MLQSLRLSTSSGGFVVLKTTFLLIYFLFFSVGKICKKGSPLGKGLEPRKSMLWIRSHYSKGGGPRSVSVCSSRPKWPSEQNGGAQKRGPVVPFAPHVVSPFQNLARVEDKLFMYINVL